MIDKDDFNRVLEKARLTRAMVIGDVMLDKYIYGSVDRISPEAPVPVVNHLREEVKAGGAANVALNLAAWGCKTALVGLTGRDESAVILEKKLSEAGIDHVMVKSAARPTSVKTRIVAQSHQLLRIDQESSMYLTGEDEIEICTLIGHQLKRFHPHLIVLEDYNKGLLSPAVIHTVIQWAKDHHAFVAVDPKEINFTEYKKADLFKPNLREASQASRQKLNLADLARLAEHWRHEMELSTVAITTGADGLYLQNQSSGIQVRPHHAVEVIDVCGAGDAVVCALALGLIGGLSLEKCGELANLTGAYVCSHSGVVAVNVADIYQWI